MSNQTLVPTQKEIVQQTIEKTPKSIKKTMRFRKREIQKYNWSINYIREELSTDRHILACLGSAGLTFNDDVLGFFKYCLQVGAKDIVDEMRELKFSFLENDYPMQGELFI